MAALVASPTDADSITLDKSPPSPAAKAPSANAKSSFKTDEDEGLSPSASPHVMALQGLGALDRAVKLLSAVTASLPDLIQLVGPLTQVSQALAQAVPMAIAASVAPNPMLDLTGSGQAPPMAGPPPMQGPAQVPPGPPPM